MRIDAIKIYFVFCVVVAGLMTYANFKGYYVFEQILSQVNVVRE